MFLAFLAAAFFFAGAFLAAFFFAGMRRSPLSIRRCGGLVNDFVNKLHIHVSVIITIFLSNFFLRNSEIIFTISRAIIFFEAREIFFRFTVRERKS